MKFLIRTISVGLFSIIAFACNNDFLSKAPDKSSLSSDSEILISPDWEAKDFNIIVPVGNAPYSIVQNPNWLYIQSMSGQFTNNVATINCKASVNNSFSGIGIYKSSVVMNIDGYGRLAIPISYITQGNPTIAVDNSLALKYNSNNNNYKASLVIRNTGEGILLWSIAGKPDWISIPGSLNNHTLIIPQNGQYVVDVSCNIESITSPDLQGQILFASNDRNNSKPAATVYFDKGAPVLQYDETPLNFGQTGVSRSLDISNPSEGLLIWRIESCPEWLSVSEKSGFLTPHSSKTLVFTCDRGIMPNEQIYHAIFLITNDISNIPYPITIAVDNTYIDNPDIGGEDPPSSDTE